MDENSEDSRSGEGGETLNSTKIISSSLRQGYLKIHISLSIIIWLYMFHIIHKYMILRT